MSTITRYRGDTYSIEATISKTVDSVETLLDFTTGNNTATFSFAKGTKRVSIPGVNGTVDGKISFPFPEEVFAGTYNYDIQVTSNTGEVRTYIKSTLEIRYVKSLPLLFVLNLQLVLRGVLSILKTIKKYFFLER